MPSKLFEFLEQFMFYPFLIMPNDKRKKVMNAIKQKKLTCFLKKLRLENFEEKIYASQLLESQTISVLSFFDKN